MHAEGTDWGLAAVLVFFPKTAEMLFDVICANALTHQGEGQ